MAKLLTVLIAASSFLTQAIAKQCLKQIGELNPSTIPGTEFNQLTSLEEAAPFDVRMTKLTLCHDRGVFFGM